MRYFNNCICYFKFKERKAEENSYSYDTYYEHLPFTKTEIYVIEFININVRVHVFQYVILKFKFKGRKRERISYKYDTYYRYLPFTVKLRYLLLSI